MCTAGTYSTSDGSAPFPSSCHPCVSGKFSAIMGASSEDTCYPCLENYYASANGSTECLPCFVGFASAASASECALAAVGFYLSPSTAGADDNGDNDDAGGRGAALPCPSGAVCSGQLSVPVPRKGYWVDRSRHSYIGSIFECFRKSACKGGGNPEEFGCWSESAYSDPERNSSICGVSEEDLLCEEGNFGPLCGACLKHYAYSAALGRCMACNSDVNMIPITIFAVIAGLLMLVLLVVWIRSDGEESFSEALLRSLGCIFDVPPFSFLKHITRGDAKVLYSALSIIGSISWSLNIKFPAPFSTFSDWLSVLQLNFIGLDCIGSFDGPSVYYGSVILFSLLPVGLGALALLVRAGRISLVVRWSEEDHQPNLIRRIEQQTWSQILLLSYVSLPPVSFALSQGFDCATLSHEGSGDTIEFLRISSNIDCKASRKFSSYHGHFWMNSCARPFPCP